MILIWKKVRVSITIEFARVLAENFSYKNFSHIISVLLFSFDDQVDRFDRQ